MRREEARRQAELAARRREQDLLRKEEEERQRRAAALRRRQVIYPPVTSSSPGQMSRSACKPIWCITFLHKACMHCSVNNVKCLTHCTCTYTVCLKTEGGMLVSVLRLCRRRGSKLLPRGGACAWRAKQLAHGGRLSEELQRAGSGSAAPWRPSPMCMSASGRLPSGCTGPLMCHRSGQ